jgi:hypothetical protein
MQLVGRIHAVKNGEDKAQPGAWPASKEAAIALPPNRIPLVLRPSSFVLVLEIPVQNRGRGTKDEDEDEKRGA